MLFIKLYTYNISFLCTFVPDQLHHSSIFFKEVMRTVRSLPQILSTSVFHRNVSSAVKNKKSKVLLQMFRNHTSVLNIKQAISCFDGSVGTYSFLGSEGPSSGRDGSGCITRDSYQTVNLLSLHGVCTFVTEMKRKKLNWFYITWYAWHPTKILPLTSFFEKRRKMHKSIH